MIWWRKKKFDIIKITFNETITVRGASVYTKVSERTALAYSLRINGHRLFWCVCLDYKSSK